MVTWSPEDVDVGIQSLLIQFYPILLSTLLSINRDQLSTFDALFALVLSSSPLTIYLVVTSIADLCGVQTGLYKRIKSHRFIIRAFGASLLLIWTGLSMTAKMSTSAFKDSPCRAGPFINWFWYVATFLMYFFMYPGGMGNSPGLVWVMVIPWFICLARRWSQVRADVKLHSEEASRLRVFCTWVKCAWCVPVEVVPWSAKSNAIKVHYRPQSQVVYLLPVCVLRYLLGIPGHPIFCCSISLSICAVLRSGADTSLHFLSSNAS